MIDEFVSSGEAKWGQRSDVVLLLPHGLEGQGPDHCSGRIERFLQLCAEGSMTVALPSEPANYFHLLRRHALDGVRRPLVVFTPKSMLRNRAVVSPVSDFTGGRFRSVIDDPRYRDARRPRRRASTGSSSAAARSSGSWPPPATSAEIDDTAIVRIEQLYPLPHRQLAAVLERYPNADDVRWVQEEPANQGAWPYFGLELPEKLPERLVADHAASPAADGRTRAGVVEGPRGRAGRHHRPGVPVTGPGG